MSIIRKMGIKEIPICDENNPKPKWYQIGSMKQWRTVLYQVIKHFMICNGITYILESLGWLNYSRIHPEGNYCYKFDVYSFLENSLLYVLFCSKSPTNLDQFSKSGTFFESGCSEVLKTVPNFDQDLYICRRYCARSIMLS